MTVTVPRKVRRSEWLVALAAGVLVLVATALFIGSAAAQERTGDPAKWRNYWTQLYTVFTHPRCINCHGGTDPIGGDNHGGGPMDEDFVACIECHTANTVLIPGRCEYLQGIGTEITQPDGTQRFAECVPGDEQGEIRVPTGPIWNGPGPEFTGKDMRELCLQVKQAMGPTGLLEHVRDDPLIGFAFEGRRAIADGPSGPIAAEPPPMSKDEVIEVLLRWITEAAMACSTDGTVTLSDNTMIDSRPSPFGNTAVRNKIDASVFIKSEVATSDLRYDETSTFVFRPVTPGCTATSNGELHFTAEGKPTTRYEINIGPDGTYRMRFLLGSIDGQFEVVVKEVLCRPPERRRDETTDSSTELRFGVEEQTLLPPPPGEPSLLILRGSTTEAIDDFAGAGVLSGGEQTISWDIVIR